MLVDVALCLSGLLLLFLRFVIVEAKDILFAIADNILLYNYAVIVPILVPYLNRRFRSAIVNSYRLKYSLKNSMFVSRSGVYQRIKYDKALALIGDAFKADLCRLR